MHGRGADANDLADIAPMIDGGYRFLFPNAPKAWEAAPGMTFGFTWFDGWPPQGTSLADSRNLVVDFIGEALTRYPTPAGKLIIGGFSQGALMSLDVGFRIPNPVAGIVAMSGALNEREMPDLAAHTDRPVLLVHGTYDDVIPVLAAHRTRRILEQHRVPVEYHEFPMGHGLTAESLVVVGEFIGKHLA
jgi:phospholipase/carboxylesterase